MRVSILGVGAIGTVVAANLASTNAEVHLHVRGERGAVQMVDGLRVRGQQRLDVDATRFLFSCEELPFDASLHQASDVVILACKSYVVADLVQRAVEFLKPNGVVFALSNGLGHVETLARTLGPSQVLAASTTHGAYLTPEGHAIWAGMGGVDLASPPLGPSLDRVTEVVELLNEGGLDATTQLDASALVWNKVMLNLAINPLAALAGLENGELLDPGLFATCMMIYREASMVAVMERVDHPSEHEFEELLRHVLEQTRDNTCSMLQDIKAGRRTEIDALNRAIVERAEQHGLSVPINQMLASLIEACHP